MTEVVSVYIVLYCIVFEFEFEFTFSFFYYIILIIYIKSNTLKEGMSPLYCIRTPKQWTVPNS